MRRISPRDVDFVFQENSTLRCNFCLSNLCVCFNLSWGRLDGSWQGYGVSTYYTGDKFEGIHENNERCGIGIYKWSEGRVYVGRLDRNETIVRGSKLWPEGDAYRGEMLSLNLHGYGKFTVGDKPGHYKGWWENNQFSGFGAWIFEDMQYVGEWEHHQQHGRGIQIESNGTITRGVWNDGCLERHEQASGSLQTTSN